MSEACRTALVGMNTELNHVQRELLGTPRGRGKAEFREKADELDSAVAMKRAELDILVYEEDCGNEDQMLLSCWLYRKKKTISTANDVSPYVRRYATIKATPVLAIYWSL